MERYLLELFADNRPEQSQPIEKGHSFDILATEFIRQRIEL